MRSNQRNVNKTVRRKLPNLQPFMLLILLSLVYFQGCVEKDPGFEADFNYTMEDDNHVVYTNESSGEYYSLTWNFGNGETLTTTDKRAAQEVYYPNAGDYTVSLSVLNYSGLSDTATKTISILNSDLTVSFTMETDPENPNHVTLTNTSQGTYDSFTWRYRDKSVEDEMTIDAYFPFAGTFEITLQVFKGNNDFTASKTVTIAQDDPDYLDNLGLIWSDEFEGETINSNNWTFETGAGGWGNQELQNYTNGQNAAIVDGKLVITARKVNENKEPGSYTSSRMISEGKQEFRYGRMEINAKLPSGTGVWPAIWMLGSNFRSAGWPACGEMDIMEYVGYQPNVVHATVHTPSGYAGNGSGSSQSVETCEEEFHIYGMIWTDKELVFYVDSPDNVTHTYAPSAKNTDNWPFDQPAFFILNLAVGGTWGGAEGIDNSIFPQTLEIDYVRVYGETEK
mgnify:CR=1 FL=1